jgi:hypothetical protein
MNGQTWIAAAVLALNLIVYLIASTRQIARERREIEAQIEQARKEVNERREMDLRVLGETMQAIRQKMNEMELWNRDNFARRDSVHQLAGRLETRIEALDEKMSEAFEKLSAMIHERTSKA